LGNDDVDEEDEHFLHCSRLMLKDFVMPKPPSDVLGWKAAAVRRNAET
jgi:hypothetical protein